MNAAFYDFSKFCVATMSRVLWRATATGTQYVPRSGPLIVACNHVSYLDPPVMGCLCPRRISYMAKKELFTIPILGPTISALGAYAVDRHGSATAAIKRSLDVLRTGGAIGIFPEGTRNRTGTVSPQTGVALLAALADAPVLPVAISGSDRALRFSKIRVAFGRPLALSGGRKATRADLAKFTSEIMNAIGALSRGTSGDT